MDFNDLLISLRKIGRTMVLPVNKIKNVCGKALQGKTIETVLDFGSGTLFWADWFAEEFGGKVCAVDVMYDNIPVLTRNKIICYSDLHTCLKENPKISLVWACDVLHHLLPLDRELFFKEITNRTNMIIIKDIDANSGLGNFMNKLHDKIINGETVYDVFPNQLKKYFEQHGFKVVQYFIPKLWYPHFAIVAIREG